MKKKELNLEQTITISKEEFMNKTADLISEEKASGLDSIVGLMFTLFSAKLTKKLFDEETEQTTC